MPLVRVSNGGSGTYHSFTIINPMPLNNIGTYYPETIINYEYDSLTLVGYYNDGYNTRRSFSGLTIGAVYLFYNSAGHTSNRINATFSCTGGQIISVGTHGCNYAGGCLVLFKATSTSVTIIETSNFNILYEGGLLKVD